MDPFPLSHLLSMSDDELRDYEANCLNTVRKLEKQALDISRQAEHQRLCANVAGLVRGNRLSARSSNKRVAPFRKVQDVGPFIKEQCGELLHALDSYRLNHGCSWDELGRLCGTSAATLFKAVRRGSVTDRIAARIVREMKTKTGLDWNRFLGIPETDRHG
jgi:hypothetical protein